MAFWDDNVSVKQRVCWVTLFRGRLTRLTRLRVAVSHGATFLFKTTLGEDRGAKAAAEDGSRTVGIMTLGEKRDTSGVLRRVESEGGEYKRM